MSQAILIILFIALSVSLLFQLKKMNEKEALSKLKSVRLDGFQEKLDFLHQLTAALREEMENREQSGSAPAQSTWSAYNQLMLQLSATMNKNQHPFRDDLALLEQYINLHNQVYPNKPSLLLTVTDDCPDYFIENWSLLRFVNSALANIDYQLGNDIVFVSWKEVPQGISLSIRQKVQHEFAGFYRQHLTTNLDTICNSYRQHYNGNHEIGIHESRTITADNFSYLIGINLVLPLVDEAKNITLPATA